LPSNRIPLPILASHLSSSKFWSSRSRNFLLWAGHHLPRLTYGHEQRRTTTWQASMKRATKSVDNRNTVQAPSATKKRRLPAMLCELYQHCRFVPGADPGSWKHGLHQRENPDDTLAAVRARCLGEGVPPPTLETLKDFMRFYVATSRPVLTGRTGKTTVDSTNTTAEWFFAGFSRVTTTEINGADRSEIYHVSAPGKPHYE
jgi:hypothetical protein